MRVRSLHPWDLLPREAVTLQKRLALRVKQKSVVSLANVRIIGGLDVSCRRGDPLLTAGVVLWDRLTGKIVEKTDVQAEETFPYIPGLLSFREVPILKKALQKLQHIPDVLLVDGHGRAHPRRFGIASHLGLLLDVPTIGVAKSRLVGENADPGPVRGSSVPLLHKGEVIGRILRSRERSKPIFISVGNRISLDGAEEIVRACLRSYRLPEPTRLAHLHVNLIREQRDASYAAQS